MAERITSAFGATSTAREVAAGPDLTGTRAIVTGGASGIGVETARALAAWTEANPFEGVQPHAIDPETADRLWAVSQVTTGVKL